MNIMKKKPELLKKTGKSSQTLRKFVNNLKENDLHYENKQITQCVFLGVLRLKPVPSIFSNKVPSVSTPVESSKPKKVKNNNSNRELNKNASKKHNINKVLSGKVSKKSPEKVKAAVKKVPTKKPNIKIKLNSKKKINEAEPSTSNGKQETLPSGTSSTVSPDSIIARSTLTLNPVISPTKFNPVQNLFDKLKQRREESQNEAGPSKITAVSSSKTKEVLKSDETKYKVCKINANGRNTPLSCKKLKKSCKKSHERLTLPLMSTSPITVSDTESVGKKDSDIILLDENNSNNGDSSDNGIVEDIIIINDDSQPKNVESTLEKEIPNQEIIDKRIQNNSTSALTNANLELAGTSQCEEVIIISDEPKQTNNSEDNNTRSEKNEDIVHVTSKSDVIVIDEVREIRVSPRLKKIEEKAKEITANTEKTVVDEVVVVPDEKKISSKVSKILQDPVDISKTQELNITIENRQTENKKLKTSPRLLKIADASKDISVTVKKELIEEVVVVNEKPKRRKNTMRSPTLPPMLLNAPMLLRSELAPKKPNYVNEKPRVRNSRNKIKDSNLKSAIPVIEPVKNISRDESTKLLNKNTKTLQLEKETSRLDQGYSSPGIKHSTVSTSSECDIHSDGLLSDEIICVDDSKNKNTDGRGIIKKLHVTQHKNVNKVKIEEVKETTCKHLTQNENSQDSSSKMCENKSIKDIIVLNDELTKSELKNKKQKIKIFNRKPVSEVSVHKEEDIVIIKEENNSKEKISPRLLRSDLLKQKKLTEAKNITEKIESEVSEFINLIDTSELGKRISPRTLRSNIIKKGPTNRDSSAENTIVIKDEEVSALNETFEKLPETEKSQQKIKKLIQKTKQADLDEIIIVNDRRVKKQREKYSGRLLRSELSQLNAKEKLPVKTELEEVIVLIHDEPKDKQKSAVLPLQSNATSSDHIENVIVVPEEERNQAEVRAPRSLRSDRIRKVNAVTSPKPRTSRMVKMENDSLPNSSLDQQLPVDDVVIILQANSEQMENVIVVPDDQIKVQSPRSLRSDRVRKVNLEMTSSKSRPQTSKIGKMESNFIPNVSTNQHDIIPQRNAEQMGSVILVPDEQKNETEVQSPRPLRSDRVRKVNAEVISPKPRTGFLKMENNPSPNFSVNLQLDVDVLPVIAQRNSEQMENVIVVLDEQINQTEVQSPRSLRSERIRKVNPEVTSLKPKTSRIIKMENNSLSNSSIDVDDLPIISQRNLEEMENVIILPDDQTNQTEAPSPRSLRSDRVRKVNSEVTSPKSRTSRILKIDNIRSLPTSSANQQLDVNDLHVIPQKNSEQKENVIVAPEEQKNQMEVQSPRSLRSDRIRKVNLDVTEVTSKPLPNSSISQQLDVNDMQIVSETNSEQSLTDVPQIKIERPNLSHRLLRSETIRKELPENANISNTNIDNTITSPRLLRSEISSQRNSQNLTKEQSLTPNTNKTRTPQKSRQPDKISNTSLQVDPVKVVVIQNELLASQNFNKTILESANGVQNAEVQKPYKSSVSRKNPKSFGKHSGILAGSKKVLTSKKKKTFHNRVRAPKTSMLLRSELAQLKNVANGIKPSEKKISKKKANSVVEFQRKQKKKRFLKTKIVQTEDSNNISKSEKHVEMIEFKKDSMKNTTPIQSMVESSDNHVPKTQNISQKEIPSTEAIVVIEENKNPKKSPARRNKSSDILYNKNPKSEKHVQMIDFKKGAMRNSTPAQSMDVCEVSETSNSQKEISSTEETVIIEENRNPKNSPTRRNKSSDILYKNNPKSEKHVEIIELKEGAMKNSTSVQNMDVCKVLETSNSQREILSTETTVISKENKNLRNSPTRRNKSSNILYKNNSKSEKHIEIMETKKAATKNSTPIQSLDVCEVLETSNCQNEIPCTEATVIIEENENPKNSSTRRNKSSDILHGAIVQSEGDAVTTENVFIKKNSPGKRKKNKRKRKLKSEEEQKTAEEGHPAQHQDIQEENEKCDIIPKKADITVFDFDESEPEVVPLRLNSTPKKEKSAMFTNKESIKPSEGNVTPKSKKPRVADEPTTKAQAKVQLLAVFDESSTQINDLDIPANPDKNKTKPTPRRKTVKDQLTQAQLSCQQTENVKKKRGRPKASPNKTNTPPTSQSQDTPKNTPRTSTSPLKQTTITDMFNVMMKKEKSSVDSVFEPAPKEAPLAPRKEPGNNNTKTDMPPPKLDRKPAPNEEDEEYYEDDSDCESRMEWIPEEYAEYKFKYSAKKMMTYKPIHKCKICLLILPTYYKLSKHKEEHAKKQNPYNCKQCEESFSNVEDLTAHLRVHKGKHPYTCKKCDVGFWSKKSLDAHTPIHVLRKVKQPNKRFRCDVCAKEFSKLCDMERHTRVHTGEKPCICNICNKRFQQSHNLSKHLLTHLHVKPFHCEICNKQFGRNDVLNRHLLTHSVEKPIKCPLCSKGFIRQSQLNNHMKKNHLDAAKIGAPAEQVAEAK